MDLQNTSKITNTKKYLEAFLKKAKEKYGDKFKYDISHYAGENNNDSYITVYCTKHNLQYKSKPSRHLKHEGCRECFREKQVFGLDKFLEKAKTVHGDTYDYSKVNYVANNKHVDILCKKHGIFRQKPSNHLKGQRCPKCFIESIRKKESPQLTTSDPDIIKKYLDRLRQKYPLYKFDNYIHYDKPCKVTCPIHGGHYSTPHFMLRKNGVACKLCSRNSDKKREEFISKAKLKHGDKFDYSKTDISEDPALFICRKHGEFRQWKRSHLIYDYCCPKCVRESISLSKEAFLEKAIKKFGYLYDYNHMDYKNANTKIKIICPLHGEFYKTPSEHIRVKRFGGCQLCSSVSHFEKIVAEILRKNNIKFLYQYTLPEYNFRWDFYIPSIKLVIEIDDDTHNYNNNDEIKDFIIKKLGGSTVRIKVITKYDKNNLVANIENALRYNIMYKQDNIVFRSFLDFSKYNNLPPKALAKDYSKFRFILK